MRRETPRGIDAQPDAAQLLVEVEWRRVVQLRDEVARVEKLARSLSQDFARKTRASLANDDMWIAGPAFQRTSSHAIASASTASATAHRRMAKLMARLADAEACPDPATFPEPAPSDDRIAEALVQVELHHVRELADEVGHALDAAAHAARASVVHLLSADDSHEVVATRALATAAVHLELLAAALASIYGDDDALARDAAALAAQLPLGQPPEASWRETLLGARRSLDALIAAL